MEVNREVRPLEGIEFPFAVRLELRQLFQRWLPSARRQHSNFGQSGETIDEVEILRLCQHYRLEYFGDTEDLAKKWDQSPKRIADGGPTFDELVRLGWLFFDGGRWVTPRPPMGTRSYIKYPSESTKNFLTELSKVRFVARTERPTSAAKALAKRVLDRDWLNRRIPTKNPQWLASRLWERLCPKPAPSSTYKDGDVPQNTAWVDHNDSESPSVRHPDTALIDKAFLEWTTWCEILGTECRWDVDWQFCEMRYCHEAAERVLTRQTLWDTWDNDFERHADVIENTFSIPIEKLRYAGYSKRMLPRTLVFRSSWLDWPANEAITIERLHVGVISCALTLLCSELEETDIGQSIEPTVKKVMEFVSDHPMALQQILFRINAAPALLIDMLFHERTGCLATKLVIEWRSNLGRISDRILSRDAQTKDFAIQDALSILAFHLTKDVLDLEEFAALVTWCFDDAKNRNNAVADPRKIVGQQLLFLAKKREKDDQSVMLRYLVAQAEHEDNIPRARFFGVLEGLGYLSSANEADILPVVALYSKFASNLNLDWTDAPNLSAELAARLVAAAFSQSLSAREALLFPFDSTTLLQDVEDEKRISLQTNIARTLRIHIRLLARSVAGWHEKDVPAELRDALKILTSRNVIEHAEKGRIGSLTDRYSPQSFFGQETGTPAQDLSAAWRNLDPDNQEALLQALVQSDDPVLLSELCQNLPAAAIQNIQAKLRQLGPGEASKLWTWTELRHRIESFLLAGEYALAREYLKDAEQKADRAPLQVRLSLFSLELQLCMKEKNWGEIESAILPVGLDAPTSRQAQDQLDFYKATSQLLRPDGNLAAARKIFQRLSTNRGSAIAYTENLFALAIQEILGTSSHLLTGTEKISGENLVAEMSEAISANPVLAGSSNLLANRALLMVALGRPSDALVSVTAIRGKMRSPALERAVVIAKAEMGLRDEAMAILNAAITEFGYDNLLIELKADLQRGETTPHNTLASVVADPIPSIRAALQQLVELPPSLLGDILGPPGGGVHGYLIRLVSRALAALQHMSAMLRNRTNPKDEAKFEDDLNTAVREILNASLTVTKWNVADQSLGGSTPKGNPGERDAVIRVSGQEISIYEALVCQTLDRADIKLHFDKLLSYGICEIYFHVIYSYASRVANILDYVAYMVEHDPPTGLIYRGCYSIGPPDYETSGYVATYGLEHREIVVVFFVADLKT